MNFVLLLTNISLWYFLSMVGVSLSVSQGDLYLSQYDGLSFPVFRNMVHVAFSLMNFIGNYFKKIFFTPHRWFYFYFFLFFIFIYTSYLWLLICFFPYCPSLLLFLTSSFSSFYLYVLLLLLSLLLLLLFFLILIAYHIIFMHNKD